jgi:hypothetical protein
MIFKHTGIYIDAVLPPVEQEPWPEAGWPNNLNPEKWEWIEYLVTVGNNEERKLPPKLAERQRIIQSNWHEITIEDLISLTEEEELGNSASKRTHRNRVWQVCKALLELHGLADETCAGFGTLAGHYWEPHYETTFDGSFETPEARNGKRKAAQLRKKAAQLHFAANSLLAHTGSLSRIPKHILRVLPKIRTASVGLTLRGASHYLTVHMSEANIKWRTLPLTNIDEDTINIMIVPFPYEFEPTWFSASRYTTHRNSKEHTRYFSYSGPDYELQADYIIQLLEKAEENVNRVHVIVLPESAITRENLQNILTALADRKDRDKLPLVLAGVRSEHLINGKGKSNLGANQAVLAAFFAGKWYLTIQNKHHRWKIEESQIRQYNLGGVLASSKEWWEAIDIPRRELSIFASNQWFTLCSLICEDLARQEPIADIIRGIGPTLLIALLLDGPQLEGRWPGRYVSVLADDPGSSVLSVTSLGFTQRSKPANGRANSTTIAIWKDRFSGTKTIDLPEDGAAVVITATAHWVEEVTLAGRSDQDSGAVLVWQGSHVIKAPRLVHSYPHTERYQTGNSVQLQFIESDRYDFRELSLFACLVAAVLDSDKAGIANLRDAMLKGELAKSLAASEDVERLIKQELKRIEEENENAVHLSGKLRDHVEPYVIWFCQLMENILDELKKKATGQLPNLTEVKDSVVELEKDAIELFELIVKYASGILHEVSKDEFEDKLLNGDPFEEIRRTTLQSLPEFNEDTFKPPTSKNQLLRVYIYVCSALLWAIHSRLTDLRHTYSLNPRRSELLSQIEDLLKAKYDDKWRGSYGSSQSF